MELLKELKDQTEKLQFQKKKKPPRIGGARQEGTKLQMVQGSFFWYFEISRKVFDFREVVVQH